MTTNTEALTEMVKKFGQHLIDKAEQYVGDDIKVTELDISVSFTVAYEVPRVICKRVYIAPDLYVDPERRSHERRKISTADSEEHEH